MKRTLCLATTFLAINAHAFIETPVFNPASPIPQGVTIAFNVAHGVCDGFPVADRPYEIAYSGNEIQFTVVGVRLYDLALCSIPLRNPQFELPPLPSGNYVLHFRVRDNQRPERIYTVAPVPFTVGSAPVIRSEAVPGLDSAGMAILVLGMFGAAFVGLRKT